MTSAHRRQRGRETQRLAAEFLADNGFPSAESTPASIPGTDVLGLPGVDCEVKAARDGSPLAALRQSAKRPGEVHMVVQRPDGYGPSRVAEWPVTFTFAEAVWLLRMAGFGDPIEGAA